MTLTRVRIDVAERRARLARRHLLAPAVRATTPLAVARGMVAVHATDPATVILSIAARLADPQFADIERALYVDRELIRMLGMRRTMFVVPDETAHVVQAACGRQVAAQQRKVLLGFLEAADFTHDVETWLDELLASTLRALRRRGSAVAAELTKDEPRLRQQLVLAPGKKYEAQVNVTARTLLLLAADGHIVRGRPRGTWISSQYVWHPIEDWLPTGFDERLTDDARAELLRQWLACFGPGTLADLRWWTGLGAGDVKRALAALDVVEVELDERTGFILTDDVEPSTPVEPAAALLPALDTTVMGWAGRDWFLGGHRPALFDTNGNAGPTIWWDGRVVGGWGQRRDGTLPIRILEDVGREATVAIEERAAWLADWIGPVRVTPRFRTPLERELTGS